MNRNVVREARYAAADVLRVRIPDLDAETLAELAADIATEQAEAGVLTDRYDPERALRRTLRRAATETAHGRAGCGGGAA